jgi:hypothetical protein
MHLSSAYLSIFVATIAFMALLATILLATAVASQYTLPLPNPSPNSCPEAALRLNNVDGPHDNYFYSDCHSSSHVVVTSPRIGDDLDFIKPRLLVAWPAGNSGALALFEPGSGQTGTLAVKVERASDTAEAFDSIYETSAGANPLVGISGAINFNDSAILAVPILGSIRAIRQFTEGGSVDQAFQNSFGFAENSDGSASINRTWFDGVTTTTIKFSPLSGANQVTVNQGATGTLVFGPGTYRFEASFNYPQLDQLSPQESRPDYLVVIPIVQRQTPGRYLALSDLLWT